jgi:hypothetical protein
METTNAPAKKSRRTYLLAGIPCLCYNGALYAPGSGVSANLGQVLVAPGLTIGTVSVQGPAGEEFWFLTDRQDLKDRGAALKKPTPRALQVEEPA